MVTGQHHETKKKKHQRVAVRLHRERFRHETKHQRQRKTKETRPTNASAATCPSDRRPRGPSRAPAVGPPRRETSQSELPLLEKYSHGLQFKSTVYQWAPPLPATLTAMEPPRQYALLLQTLWEIFQKSPLERLPLATGQWTVALLLPLRGILPRRRRRRAFLLRHTRSPPPTRGPRPWRARGGGCATTQGGRDRTAGTRSPAIRGRATAA
ncbi:hypothetical protein JYU34_002393 [Plutella xylostella]|uniref:Uncharacterized protein n=1 Tax=Plutella xylostella TaxID=51655 RepID=A0ABQ7R288_PLUXY|nr:hypothetical protein JYU34_002393 [Plutella xylostella]